MATATDSYRHQLGVLYAYFSARVATHDTEGMLFSLPWAVDEMWHELVLQPEEWSEFQTKIGMPTTEKQLRRSLTHHVRRSWDPDGWKIQRRKNFSVFLQANYPWLAMDPQPVESQNHAHAKGSNPGDKEEQDRLTLIEATRSGKAMYCTFTATTTVQQLLDEFCGEQNVQEAAKMNLYHNGAKLDNNKTAAACHLVSGHILDVALTAGRSSCGCSKALGMR
eukprot:TRINITY_DN39990_c0_g1_i1.p1 TRINITY_DN39990_c0_g1~~TRINITY_DN39990_c0_g1_i1.p1  ORF type:complete len:246 (-),score=30.87 TRINITY_DN39990_c0_g1_i1:345-1010(-)